MSFDILQHHYRETLKDFEGRFRQSMKTEVALLDTVMSYIVRRKGKQIRPLFVFGCAGMAGGINETTHRGASLVELLHTATLVHDDVVDDSDERRGFFSINALWKNKVAVLVGDFLLSKGLLLSINHDDFHLLKIVSNAVKEMSEGELLQMEKARRLDITEDIYFEVIRKKTASLIASCCAVGAASAKASEETIEKFRQFGELCGIAFQLKDDLLDYGQGDIGKPKGIDIKERKMTLPLIYTLQNAEFKEKKFIINTFKNHNTDKKKVAEVMNLVDQKKGIAYAQSVMEKYKDEALAMLPTLGNGKDKEMMEMLVRLLTERSK